MNSLKLKDTSLNIMLYLLYAYVLFFIYNGLLLLSSDVMTYTGDFSVSVGIFMCIAVFLTTSLILSIIKFKDYGFSICDLKYISASCVSFYTGLLLILFELNFIVDNELNIYGNIALINYFIKLMSYVPITFMGIVLIDIWRWIRRG